MASRLENVIANFFEERESLHKVMNKETEWVNQMKDKLGNCDDVSGTTADIVKRLNHCKEIQKELKARDKNFKALIEKTKSLQDKYPSAETMNLKTDAVILMKKFEAVQNRADLLEMSLELRCQNAQVQEQRWINAAREKVAWCGDIAGDRYSMEAKLATIKDLMQSVSEGKKKTDVSASEVGMAKSVLPHDKQAELEKQKKKAEKDWNELMDLIEKTREKLEGSVDQLSASDNKYKKLTKWLKDTESKVRNESTLKPDLPSKVDQSELFTEIHMDVENHKPEFDHLWNEAQSISKTSGDLRAATYATQLCNRYESLAATVKEQVERCDQNVNDQVNYQDRMRAYAECLKSAHLELEETKDRPTDQETLQSKLQAVESQNLMMDPRTSAQDVIRCDLCETTVVQLHCDTCLVNLCKACVGEHFSANLSKPHKIVDFKDRKSTPVYPKCESHNKEQCEMYCKQCDIPVCINCLVCNQHLGHELSKILRILDEKKDMIIKERTELNYTIYPTYQEIASDVQKRMSQLEKEYGDLLTAITKHGEDWHREIDKLVNKLKAEVDEMKNTQLQTLQKHLDEINKTIADIKDEINSMETAIDTNDMSKLLSDMSKVQKYKNLPHKIMPSLPKFIQGKIQGEEFNKLFGDLPTSSLTSDEYGYSIKTTQKAPEAGSSPPVKQLLDQPETVTTIDTGYDRYLITVACLSDEEIWTKGDVSTMKLYSINQGALLKSIRTKSRNIPNDIAVTKSGDLVYTDGSDRTLNILKNEKREEMIRLQNWRPHGVCSTSSGNLLVIMDSDDGKQSKAVRYSGSSETQTIQFDDKCEHLYLSGRFITENKNLDICVSDWGANAVVVVNQAGKLRFRYTGHTPAPNDEPFKPRGITTDSQSHILTAGYITDCVHIIDQDGQFLRYIDCGLSEPLGLCTDTNDNLFVAQYRNKQVKKIKYMQ